MLGYLTNTKTRFTNYVERRIAAIKQLSNSSDWYYVSSADNPADQATRSTTPRQLASSNWFTGPKFLIEGGSLDSRPFCKLPEVVKNTHVFSTKSVKADDICSDILARTSSFKKASFIARRLLSWLHILDTIRQRRGVHLAPRNPFPSFSEGINCLICTTQARCYEEEKSALSRGESVPNTSSIFKFSPWIDHQGVIRMEGRLQNSALPWNVSYPVLLPTRTDLARVIMLNFHEECYHQGSTVTRSAIQQAGFQLVGGSRLIKSVIRCCATCKRLRGRAQEQKMSSLPSTRVLVPERPFTHIGVDAFGPFFIKRPVVTRRHKAATKMWGCIFTCCSSRAVHLEPLASMDTASLQRFCAIRGRPSTIRSDRGGNFMRASKTLGTIDVSSVERHFKGFNIQWLFNPPYASHFGGIYERMIGSTRRVMEGMLTVLRKKTFDWETFVTMLAEASRIINNTPLWVTSWDSAEPSALSPADLLMIRDSNDGMQPPVFSEKDFLAYGHRRYLRANYLVGCFWKRWQSDYLTTINQRSKWFRQKPVEVGDIVLVIDNKVPRTSWPLAIITRAHVSADGVIRSVSLKTGGSVSKILERPISKTVSVLPKSYYDDMTIDTAACLT